MSASHFLSDFQSLFLAYYHEDTWHAFQDLAHEFEKRFFHYEFKNKNPLYFALAVRGCKIPPTEFERLEFLGDSILQAIVGVLLYLRETEAQPGELTNLRSKLVENEHLAQIMREYNPNAVGILLGVGQLNSSQHADLFEALIAAYFLDHGSSLDQTFTLVQRLLKIDYLLEQITHSPWGTKHPKAFLLELLQKKYKSWVLEFSDARNFGTINQPLFEIDLVIKDSESQSIIEKITSKQHSTKKHAEKDACEQLLRKWQQQGLI